MRKFQVFLSFKNTDLNGNTTKDREMAANLYKELTQKGINVFFSEETLRSLGAAQYKDAIDDALDDAKVLIVVGTSVENITSNWVRYEWDSFYGDILSGKKEGQLFSYIDGINIKDLPRTLRQVQTFDASKDEIINICDYISNSLGYTNIISEKDILHKNLNKEHSNYSAIEGKESKRLINQADSVFKNDLEIISPLIRNLSKNRKINVLDLGCANGYLTSRLFNHFSGKINTIIGIDHEQKCIDNAKELYGEPYAFYHLDLEAEAFEDELERIMEKHNIDAFDFVISTLVFHHLDDPIKVMKKMRKYIRKGGKFYIRSCDDDEVVAYPDKNGLVKKVIKNVCSLPGISDRIHGRKLYYEFYKAGYTNISIKPFYVTTAEMDIDERIQFCKDMLLWPRARYKKLLDGSPNNIEYLKMYNDFCANYEEIEEMFYDPAFYFKVAGPIAIATK
ncbi:MAG: methyltransferase domain-containing protein [Clostridia bacterium]|nr:methyltransferase domain-containing protein [Clostridia bacterium]